MLNALPFPLNKSLPVGNSGVATFVGDTYRDEQGAFRVVISTDAALLPGQAVCFKNGDGVSGVIKSSAVSGVGTPFAGLVISSGIGAGEIGWVQYEGEAYGMTAAASIVFGDRLVVSASGTLAEEGADGGTSVKGGSVVAVALAAGAGLGVTSTSRVLLL